MSKEAHNMTTNDTICRTCAMPAENRDGEPCSIHGPFNEAAMRAAREAASEMARDPWVTK